MLFRNKFYFLSNMFPCTIKYRGFTFTCVESAFQACKDESRTKDFVGLNGFEAKKLGRRVHLRKDWDNVKVDIMEEILRIKFSNETLRKALLATGSIDITEENTWGDTYWGICNGVGKNTLGELLMKIRNDLK